MLIEVLSGREGVLPHVDCGREVNRETEFRQCHVEFVHGREVFPGLAVRLGARALRVGQNFLHRLLTFLLVNDLE